MAMGRVVYHKPKFAILDECTSAVSWDIESHLYNLLKITGITLITVSHRATLLKHHDFVLNIDEEGGWTFSKVDKDIHVV
jgi:ATP-binding cassette subfamily D (ALD) protein 3